jgi:hypothetical protein
MLHQYEEWPEPLPTTYTRAPESYITDVLVAETREFIEGAVAENVPFFAMLATYAPHAPAVPAPRRGRLFPNVGAPRGPAFGEADVSDKPRYVSRIRPLKRNAQRGIEKRRRQRIRSRARAEHRLRADVRDDRRRELRPRDRRALARAADGRAGRAARVAPVGAPRPLVRRPRRRRSRDPRPPHAPAPLRRVQDGRARALRHAVDPNQLENVYGDADGALVAALRERLAALRACAGASCRALEDFPVPEAEARDPTKPKPR